MISPAKIKQKAEKMYVPFLSAWIQGQQFFPKTIPVGAPPPAYQEFRQAAQALFDHAKESLGYGYTLKVREKNMGLHGKQSVPVQAILETAQDLLELIGKEDEFEQFCSDVSFICQRMPNLITWMQRNPREIIAYHALWPNLLAVCEYFLQHPRPGLYIRELPIPAVPTKFVEGHKGIIQQLLCHLLPTDQIDWEAETFEERFGLKSDESSISVRFLDGQLERQYRLPLTEMSLPLSQFILLNLQGQYCIITENKRTFRMLPPRTQTFALFGSGSQVSTLGAVHWLHECPIIYWGDLDPHGFLILSRLRAHFPHVISVMMDEETLNGFAEYCVKGTPWTGEHPTHLTEEEYALFLKLQTEEMLLEQEHIAPTYALAKLEQVFQSYFVREPS